MLKPIIKAVAVTAVTAVTMSAGGAYAADSDTAYVPFVVNVDAVVTAEQGGKTPVTLNVAAGELGTLELPLGTSSVLNQSRGQGRHNAPVVTGSRGNITLRLPGQAYRNAEIALYSVNGKRVLRSKVAASEAASGISRRNVASGVYMLSVKGANGEMFTSRLTHSGGKMNIGVAFGVENVSPVAERQFAKAAEAGDWDITVSAAAVAAGYRNYGYALNPVAGNDNAKQVINLTTGANVVYGVPVTYGGESYQTVVIGEQTWLARNLNYDAPNPTTDVCYETSADSCAKYGRLYNWATAMNGAMSSSAVPSGVQGVCPIGWHLPSDAEWTALTDAVGGSSTTAGGKLKSISGWYNNGNGTDNYGFSALPGGLRDWFSDNFNYAGNRGRWWSATEADASNAWLRRMSYNNNDVSMGWDSKSGLFSVRCVED